MSSSVILAMASNGLMLRSGARTRIVPNRFSWRRKPPKVDMALWRNIKNEAPEDYRSEKDMPLSGVCTTRQFLRLRKVVGICLQWYDIKE